MLRNVSWIVVLAWILAAANTPASAAGGSAATAPAAKTTTYTFPDGTGSIEIPDGWQTTNQSCMGGITINGPEGQTVLVGIGCEVLTPDSQLVQMHNQLVAQARAMRLPPPPPIAMLVAPFSAPADAVKNLFPQFSAFSQAKGLPALRLDKIIQTTDAPAAFPNGKAALIDLAFTKTQAGRAAAFRASAQVETYPIGPGTWGMFVTELAAPDAIFARDLPLMQQTAQSLQCNGEVIQQITNQIIWQNNQRFCAFEESMRQRNCAFDRQMESWRHQQRVQSRSNDEFDEYIRGH